MKRYHRHLIRNIPNYAFTRYLVRLTNRLLVRSDSRWQLRIKYRLPKPGEKWGWGGQLRRDQARAFSIYLRVRDAAVAQYDGYYALADLLDQIETVELQACRIQSELESFVATARGWRRTLRGPSS
jgi:hypothetical protein